MFNSNLNKLKPRRKSFAGLALTLKRLGDQFTPSDGFWKIDLLRKG